MPALLRTRDIQDLIEVDKSTIYRMAEDGRIPAIKVGRQWRFPEDQISEWLAGMRPSAASRPAPETQREPVRAGLRTILPLGATQAMIDLVADLLGAMAIVTDLDGVPLTEVSNPCGLFEAASASPRTVPTCIETWRQLGSDLDLEPRFRPTHLGFLCTRGFIRVGSKLEGMVIVGGFAPEEWPPATEQIDRMAADLGLPAEDLTAHTEEVFHLDDTRRERVLRTVPRIGAVISQLANESADLTGKLRTIASLAGTARDQGSRT